MTLSTETKAVIDHLGSHDDATVYDLVRSKVVAPGQAGTTLVNMIQAGFIEKSGNERNGWSAWRLTTKGRSHG